MFAFYPLQRELDSIQKAMNEILHNSFRQYSQSASMDLPPVNLIEKEDGVLELQLPLPGNDSKALEITYEKGHLIIQGQRQKEQLQELRAIRQEREFGSFHRVVELPYRINPDKIMAVYQDGILTVTAQRAEEDKPRKIQIS